MELTKDMAENEKKGTLHVPSLIARHRQGTKASMNQEVQYEEFELLALLAGVRRTLAEQKTMVEIHAPVIVVGDIHGQFADLQRIFQVMGPPPKKRYVFLGDYIDRGRYSLECIVLLLAYKLQYPKNIALLRGNHECAK
ncbi:MAG: hypothetical protein GY696_25670 [Gammaproteobacteria bacterium]|nr:hypothetical protein [Gammaproteobacteria bacterium]